METQTINTSSKFRGQVLQKVYRVWLFRKLLPVLVLETLALSFALYQLGRMVFVQKIMENALNVLFLHPGRIGDFLISMFSQAPILAKMLAILIIVLAALFFRHITQGLLRLFLVRQNYFRKIEK